MQLADNTIFRKIFCLISPNRTSDITVHHPLPAVTAILIESDQQINDVSAETYDGYIQRRAYDPAEFIIYRAEHDQCSPPWTDKKHIYRSIGYVSEYNIYAEGNGTEDQKSNDRCPIIAHILHTTPRDDKVKPDKDEQHMPNTGMYRQHKAIAEHARRLDNSRYASEKIEGRHKAIHRVTDSSFLQKRSDKTKIHRYRAKLKRQCVPYDAMIAEIEVHKQLLIYLSYQKKHTDTEKESPISLLAKAGKPSRQKKAEQDAADRIDKVKKSVRLRRFDLPRS